MRGSMIAAVLALGVVAAPMPVAAQQQDAVGEAGVKFYDSCRANQQGTPPQCACIAGFFAGPSKEDEFRIMAAITPFIDKTGNVPDMAAAQAAARAEQAKLGMTDARFLEVMARIGEIGAMGAYADRVCDAVARKAG